MAALLVFLSPLVFLGIVGIALHDAASGRIPQPPDDSGQGLPATGD